LGLVLALAPLSGERLAEQAAKTAILVVLLLVGFRLTGKRELAQFTVYDLAMIMALSNAVQNAMTGGLGNLPIGLVTSSTVVLVAWALSRVLARRPGLERRVLGTPTLLVSNGQPLRGPMQRARVSPEELEEACRERGVESPGDCDLVVLEIDGSMSVVPRDQVDHGDGPGPGGPRSDPAQ
jgi:uncharacterized membrane protein YcaP (DUF421 family)